MRNMFVAAALAAAVAMAPMLARAQSSSSSSLAGAEALAIAGGSGSGDPSGDYIAQHGNNVDTIPPPVYAGTNPCIGAVSGGASFLGVGLALGGTHPDADCRKRAWFALTMSSAQAAASMHRPALAERYILWAQGQMCAASTFMRDTAPHGMCPMAPKVAADPPARVAASTAPSAARPAVRTARLAAISSARLPPVALHTAARLGQGGAVLLPNAPAWCYRDGGAAFEPACVGKDVQK